jgi:hypothetical protein
MRKPRMLMGVIVLTAAAVIGHGVLAEGTPELDKVLTKADPASELVADFNELVSAATNIAPPSAAADQDRAKAADVRAALQDPAGLTMARDPSQRTAAASAAPQIEQLAASLDQNIGNKLSVDAKAGMVDDFKTVAQYMAVIRPTDAWYCGIHGLRVLLTC